jgi:hypothetical protein
MAGYILLLFTRPYFFYAKAIALNVYSFFLMLSLICMSKGQTYSTLSLLFVHAYM